MQRHGWLADAESGVKSVRSRVTLRRMRARPLVERTSRVRSPSPRALSAGFAVALGLHVLGLALVVRLGQHVSASVGAPPLPRPPEAPLSWFERADEPSPVAQAGVTEAGAGEIEPARSAAPQRVARAAVTPGGSVPAPGQAAAAAGVEEAGSGKSSGAEVVPEEPVAAAKGDQRLSLDALGVGPEHNPFLGPSPRRAATQTLGERIDHVLRSGLAEHDRQLGLGPEGPVVAAVTELVMQSTTAPNTEALLLLRTDGSGQTVHVELAEASGDTDAWNAVARSLLQALHGKKLRVPPGSGGVTMQLRVVSREQLPSGRDPGLAVDLFGQEVKAGAGERSTRLQLLTPKITLEQYQISPTDPHVKFPVIGFSLTILGVQGDLVDIGSVARRVVHSHLVSLETHPRDPEQ